MDEENVLRFLRYYWRNLVDFAIDLAELDDREKEAVELCGRRILKAVPQEKLLDVLEEHFEAVKVLYPKEYDYVLNQLSYNL